jgi:hypothetical protein
MQPTFLPWVGYFALMDRVDRFVLLDDVQFDKRSWQQRNRIKTGNGPAWLTVPVLTKGRRYQRIQDVIIQPDARFSETALKTLEHAYSKAPYFDQVMESISPAFECETESLCELNITLIEGLCDLMDLSAEIVRSSATPVTSSKAQRLANLCAVHGAERYIATPGSFDYLDGDSTFAEAGVVLSCFCYTHPEWLQLHGPFEPYMSALDLVMNTLPEARRIIRSGVGEEIVV